jgi:hypothetical protein
MSADRQRASDGSPPPQVAKEEQGEPEAGSEEQEEPGFQEQDGLEAGSKEQGEPEAGSEEQEEPEWPEHFPQTCTCPPLDSIPTNGIVYRRLDGTLEDWKSWYELKRNKGNDCQRAALSCMSSLEELKEVMAVHERWATSKIVAAHLEPIHGNIKQTGKNSHHFSLWLRRQYHKVCHLLFRVVP